MSHLSVITTHPSQAASTSTPATNGSTSAPLPHRALVVMDAAGSNRVAIERWLLPEVNRITLNADDNGIAQVALALRHHFPIHSLHLICSGSPGCLTLGNTVLDLSSLDRYAWSLQDWTLTPHETGNSKARNPFSLLQPAVAHRPHIALYASRVAEGSLGQTFVNLLAQLTGTAIAAPTRPIPHPLPAHRWELDYTTGAIVPVALFQPSPSQPMG